MCTSVVLFSQIFIFFRFFVCTLRRFSFYFPSHTFTLIDQWSPHCTGIWIFFSRSLKKGFDFCDVFSFWSCGYTRNPIITSIFPIVLPLISLHIIPYLLISISFFMIKECRWHDSSYLILYHNDRKLISLFSLLQYLAAAMLIPSFCFILLNKESLLASWFDPISFLFPLQ